MKYLSYSKNAFFQPVVTSCVAIFMLGACAPQPAHNPSNSVYLDIPFDGNGCPQQPVPIDTTKGKRVVWQSVDAATKADTKERYEIFFDPFVGKPQRSDRNGTLMSLPFERNVPPTVGPGKVEYKYTIVGDRCKDKPLDPRLWLRR